MIESFRVGVNLNLRSNVDEALDRLSRDAMRFNKLMKEGQQHLSSYEAGLRALRRAGTGMDALARSMERLDRLRGTNTNAAAGMERVARATQDAVAAGERLNAVMRANARAASDVAGAMRSGATAMERSGRGRREPPAAPGHGYGGRRYEGLMAAQELGQAGRATLGLGTSALERGMEVAHLRTNLMTDRRVTETMANQAVEAAYKATQTAPGTTVSTNLQALIDLKNQYGMKSGAGGAPAMDEALQALPAFARMTALLQTYDKKHGIKGDQAGPAVRAMDILGGMSEDVTDPTTGKMVQRVNPELLQRRLDAMTRVAVATNMRVGPEQYLGFAKQARSAGMLLSDEFIYEKLPAVMDSTGGHRAGTALMSMFQVFSKGGTLTDKNYDALAKLGLAGQATTSRSLNPNSRRLERTRTEPGVFDTDILFSDPLEWVKKAQARMEAAGIHGTQAQIQALVAPSQRSTIAGFLADLLKDQISIERGQQNIQNTRPDVAQFVAQNDPVAKMQQVQAAWDKLLATFGNAAMDDMIRVLESTTSALNSMAAWAKENPGMARVLTDSALGLGALAVALGTLSASILAFGPALNMLRGGAAGAAATGAAGAVGTASIGARALLGPAAAIGTFVFGAGALETPETRAALEAERKRARGGAMQGPGLGAPVDGFGVDGRPTGPAVPATRIGPQSSLAPGASAAPVRVEMGTMNFSGTLVTPDGQTLGRFAAASIARDLRRAPGGTTGPDIRTGLPGGLAGAV